MTQLEREDMTGLCKTKHTVEEVNYLLCPYSAAAESLRCSLLLLALHGDVS